MPDVTAFVGFGRVAHDAKLLGINVGRERGGGYVVGLSTRPDL